MLCVCLRYGVERKGVRLPLHMTAAAARACHVAFSIRDSVAVEEASTMAQGQGAKGTKGGLTAAQKMMQK